jgi:hypothetical protein
LRRASKKSSSGSNLPERQQANVLAEHWRKLADAARGEAERTINARTRQMIVNMAQTYDRLAEEADWEKPPSE